MILRRLAVLTLCFLAACAGTPDEEAQALPSLSAPTATAAPDATQTPIPESTPYPFDYEERVNALGQPMVTSLTPRSPIAAGTRVSDLLADPGRYFEQEEFDPSDILFPGALNIDSAWASYRWLADRPDDVVFRTIESDVLRESDIQPESFADVIVAGDHIPAGTTIAELLAEQDRYLHRVIAPNWNAQPWNALNERTLSRLQERSEEYATCTVSGPIAVGEVITFEQELEAQGLSVVSIIPAGTTADEIVASPTVWLSARFAPGCDPNLIHNIGALKELQGLVTLRDLEGGYLTTDAFGSPDDVPAGVDVRPTPTSWPSPTPRPAIPPTRNVYVAAQDLPAGLTISEIMRDPTSYLGVVELPIPDVAPDALVLSRTDVQTGDFYAKLTKFQRCVVEQPVAAGEQFLLNTDTTRALMSTRALAAETTVGEIQANPDEYLAETSVPECEVTEDYITSFDDISALDPDLFLRSVIDSRYVLRFSSFGDTLADG